MKIKLIIGLLVLAQGVIIFVILKLDILSLSKPPLPIIPINQGDVNKPISAPELSEDAKKRMGLSGPFPTGEETSPKERNIGKIINAWREAIVIKRIDDITRLTREIQGMGLEAIPFLSKLAKEDENERVRAFAVRSMGSMRSADLADLYVELLRKDQSEFVRENSIWALQVLGNPKYIPALEKAAEVDKSEKIRQLAKEAINTLDSANKNK
ncbi:MAG: HEAT repeat domain-containing protein [Planctomycetes bacterium]|nr:HEAT repeat domain-containing protein [Planctomycetota bacterium]